MESKQVEGRHANSYKRVFQVKEFVTILVVGLI
jgi:hypothetical protein